ncbi:MAG: hypothetical protein IJS61_00135 [Firmicutes bacterium]|nr:hypothetical protein [Bacillota bacterium]
MLVFFTNEEGAASIEIAIITVTLVTLAILFRKQLLSLAKAVANKILGD